MREPDRWDHTLVNQGCWDANSEMYKHAQGDYVEFDDYQELQDRYEDLKADYENLRAAVTDVYRDM